MSQTEVADVDEKDPQWDEEDNDTGEQNATKPEAPPCPPAQENTASDGDAGQNRPVAKRAQRTRRLKVTPGDTANAKPAANAAKSQGGKKKAADENNLEPREEHEEEEEEGEGDDEPSKVLEGLKSLGQGLLDVFVRSLKRCLAVVKAILRFFWRIISSTRSLLVPGFGLLFFLCSVYLVAEYAVTQLGSGDLITFSDRLHYVIKASVWNFFLIGLVNLVQQWDQRHAAHRLFLANTFDDTLLLLLNCALLATHLETEQMHWIQAVLHTAAACRLLYWFGLIGKVGALHRLCNTPRTAFNFGLLTFNLWVIVGRDLGYLTPEVTAPTHEGEERPSGWFS